MEAKPKCSGTVWSLSHGGTRCPVRPSRVIAGKPFCAAHARRQQSEATADAEKAVVVAAEAWADEDTTLQANSDALLGAVRALRAAREGGG